MSYDYSATVEFLLDWYECNARILPWREDPSPYHVWVSEIMLQQTRVEAVKAYYERFLLSCPDIRALATIEEEKLLKLWEGLGYYSRVKNLQKAAQCMVKEYDGEVPRDYESLKKLPGIGDYTAGAICSIAFSLPEPAVDGNVCRVMMRLSGQKDDISKEATKKFLREEIKKIMPKGREADFTQSIMELGALVCIPNGKPLCEKCPLMHLCRAFHEGTQESIPVKAQKRPRKIEEKTVFVLEWEGRFAVHKRENKGLLAGMWELPNMDGQLSPGDVNSLFKEPSSMEALSSIFVLPKAKHIFSHVEWHMVGFHVISFRCVDWPENNYLLEWKTGEEIKKNCAIPSAFSAYLEYLCSPKK